MTTYTNFLDSKRIVVKDSGVTVSPEAINPLLFPFQRDLVCWALRKGRAAIFADTGLGKTFMQIEWARLTGERTLILAPLAVARQTVNEAKLIGLEVRYVRSSAEVVGDGKLYITNYEMLDHFDPDLFGAVVLDESSILKNLTGKIRNQLVKMFRETKFKLCATATPAPNDISELGNHSEFLNVMSPYQMTSIYFVHEAGVFQGVQASRWRLKKHGKAQFYRWLASWGIAVKRPSDLGYSDDDYKLPPLSVDLITVNSNYTPEGMLPGFYAGGISATHAKRLRRETIAERAKVVAGLVNNSSEQWVVWAGLNDEANALVKAIPGAVNVEGSMKPEAKADALEAFINGSTRVLITKTSIAGFGMNMQRAHNMIFFGLDFSWEQYYQAIRRMYRFGQKQKVNVHIVISEQERPIFETVMLKEREAIAMTEELIKASREYSMEELRNLYRNEWKYKTDKAGTERWTLLLGDSAERMAEVESDSVHLSVYSPPFSDMYVYNNTERDLSNSLDMGQFFEHYGFIIRENLRVTMPGRVACVHVQDPKTFQNREGYRGLRDFTGDVIKAYTKEGWIYRTCITIDKNPQIVASRNKDTDLLFITGQRDSADLAPMATDYLLVFKKPGENKVPIKPYSNGEMTEDDWISWAHAVWYGIRETDVLNVAVAKGNDDEKHMCPLQLPLIERCLKLWSNPGELIFSPFAGIGSEGYVALKHKRRTLGIELKPEYFNVACRNLRQAEEMGKQVDLFTWAETQQNSPEPDDFERQAKRLADMGEQIAMQREDREREQYLANRERGPEVSF